MSFWSRLFNKAAPPPAPAAAATIPMSHHPSAAGSSSDAKQLRQQRREALFGVVREAMLRQELLASHYKFKVLSVDSAGRQFMVMVDWLAPQALPLATLNAVERLVAQDAAHRYDLQVKAMYWRQADAVQAQPTPAPPQAAAGLDRTAPAHAMAASAAPTLAATASASAAPPAPPGFEPIAPDELNAFQAAMAQAVPTKANAATDASAPTSSGPRVPSELGFMDTQILDDDAPDTEHQLSRTQFGDL
ncbi:MAG: hypothetical protein Fur007_01830 [Rhodoferax sp.]